MCSHHRNEGGDPCGLERDEAELGHQQPLRAAPDLDERDRSLLDGYRNLIGSGWSAHEDIMSLATAAA
jgi:hypothetical protein